MVVFTQTLIKYTLSITVFWISSKIPRFTILNLNAQPVKYSFTNYTSINLNKSTQHVFLKKWDPTNLYFTFIFQEKNTWKSYRNCLNYYIYINGISKYSKFNAFLPVSNICWCTEMHNRKKMIYRVPLN